MEPAAIATFLQLMSFLCLATGGLAGSRELLAAGTIGAGLAYALRDYLRPSRDSVTVMTLYMGFASLWFGLGNLAGYLVEGGRHAARFYQYEVAEHIFTAQLIGSIATIVPGLAYDFATTHARKGLALPRFLPVGFSVTRSQLVRASLGLVALNWAARLGGLPAGGLGTLSTLVDLGSTIGIFSLTFLWLDGAPPRPARGLALPVCLMALSAIHSFLFDPLRMNMLLPVGAFCLPFLLRKAVDLRLSFAGLVFLALYILVFEPLGEFRWQVQGTERFSAVADQLRPGAEGSEDRAGGYAFLARLSTFNQLSQVVGIVEQEGLYHGKTLDYLFYVFIPRVLWPDKPTITPGRWFAEKLGRGRELDTGFSNAINMTIPGELYLNFGWIGVIVGMAGMGLLYFVLWDAAKRIEWPSNIVGMGLALMLLNQAMFGGSHFGAVVNIVIWYIAALVATWTFLALGARRARRAMQRRIYARPLPPPLSGPASPPRKRA